MCVLCDVLCSVRFVLRSMNYKKTLKIAFIVSFLIQLSLFLITSPSLSQDQASSKDYLIGSQDTLALVIYAGGEKQQETDLTVSAQGIINVPFVGSVKASGLPINKLEERITKALAKDYFVKPRVHISLKGKGYQSLKHQVSVEGEIKRPGVYNYQRGMTVLDACIMAGGFDKYAAPNRTIIIRQEDGKQIVIKVKLDDVKEGKIRDVELQPGDRIHIPETWL